MKIFFSDNVEANVKANVKQQEINHLVALSYKFFQEVPSKREIQCKKGMSFHLIFGIPSIMILSVKNRGVCECVCVCVCVCVGGGVA